MSDERELLRQELGRRWTRWRKAIRVSGSVVVAAYNEDKGKVFCDVEGDTGEYSVIVDLRRGSLDCSCRWASNHDVDCLCAHQLGVIYSLFGDAE